MNRPPSIKERESNRKIVNHLRWLTAVVKGAEYCYEVAQNPQTAAGTASLK